MKVSELVQNAAELMGQRVSVSGDLVARVESPSARLLENNRIRFPEKTTTLAVESPCLIFTIASKYVDKFSLVPGGPGSLRGPIRLTGVLCQESGSELFILRDISEAYRLDYKRENVKFELELMSPPEDWAPPAASDDTEAIS